MNAGNNYIYKRDRKNIVLIGGGNQAQYVIDIVEREGKYNIVGIIDSIKDIGEMVYGYPVIGRQQDINALMSIHAFSRGIISVGDNGSRCKVYNDIMEIDPEFIFINAIHPSVIIGNNVEIGMGVVAMAGVIINPGAKIGNFTFFATGAQVDHDCNIGIFSSISAGSVLGGHVTMGPFSAVTLGVTVFDRVTIGTNTVIGAGSLVTKDIESNVLAYGSPAKVIRSRSFHERFLK